MGIYDAVAMHEAVGAAGWLLDGYEACRSQTRGSRGHASGGGGGSAKNEGSAMDERLPWPRKWTDTMQ